MRTTDFLLAQEVLTRTNVSRQVLISIPGLLKNGLKNMAHYTVSDFVIYKGIQNGTTSDKEEAK